MRLNGASLWLVAALLSPAQAAEFYVATGGSDANPGSITQPFRTIQRCANVVSAGDSCRIRAGIYRETVIPPVSGNAVAPIVFAAYDGESVVVSGADVLTGWSAHSGSIYKAPMAWDLGPGKNQVFVNGQMMLEARWPNTGLDLLRPTLATADAGTSASRIVDAELNFAEGFWNGGILWIKAESMSWAPDAWVAQTGTITASGFGYVESPGLPLTVYNPAVYSPAPGNFYYLTGKLAALDSANEWYHDAGAAALYLWAPQGANPSGLLIEAKRRMFAFDLAGKSYITLRGIHVFAATINMKTAAHCVVENFRARYLSHFTHNVPSSWGAGLDDTGIVVGGNNNEVRNCEIIYSAGNGVRLLRSGSFNKVNNCVIHEVNYSATDCAPVHASGTGHLIQRNTLYNAGRGAVVHRYLEQSRIEYNDMYNAGLLTTDLGVIYTYATDGRGTVIAYNWIHDNKAISHAPGIYLDNNSSNTIVHHNVVYNTDDGIRLNLTAHNHEVYNNTLWNVRADMTAWGLPGSTMTAVKTYNNLSDHGFIGNDLQNNLRVSDGRFVNPAGGDFRLLAGSPAIDFGRLVPGITDGFAGAAPDAGAYEYGGSDAVSNWKAGGNPYPYLTVLDVASPSVSLTAPAPGASVSGLVAVSAVASDDVGVSRVEFLVDGAVKSSDASSPYEFLWDSRLEAPGTHILSARAYDAAGHAGDSAAISVTVGNGNQPPAVAQPARANPNPTPVGSTALSVLGSDDGGEALLTYSWAVVGTPPAPVTFGVNASNAAKNSTASFTKPGSYAIQATIRDAGGLTAVSSVTVTVLGDVTPPSVIIVSPTNGATVRQRFKVKSQGSDNLAIRQVQYLMDGAPVYTQDFNPPVASFLINPNVSAPSVGLHTLQARVTDTSNNVGSSAVITVSVKGGNNLLSVITSDADGEVTDQSPDSRALMVSSKRGASQTLTFDESVREVKILDVTGRVLARQSSDGPPIVMSLQNVGDGRLLMESGLRLIEMKTADGQTAMKPLVIVK